MNERIRELKNQTLDRHFSRTWTTMDYDDITRFAEGFARLIVRECVEICENKTDHLNPKMYEVWRGALACSSDIKQHFGVGE